MTRLSRWVRLKRWVRYHWRKTFPNKVVMQLIEKPHIQIKKERAWFGLGEHYGFCTLCRKRIGRQWTSFDYFWEYERYSLENHRCPTIEQAVNDLPKWEWIDR